MATLRKRFRNIEKPALCSVFNPPVDIFVMHFFDWPTGMHRVDIVKEKLSQSEAELFEGYSPPMLHRDCGSAGFIAGLAAGLIEPSRMKTEIELAVKQAHHVAEKDVEWALAKRRKKEDL